MDRLKELKQKGHRAFSITGKSSSSDKKFETLRDTYTKDDVQKWFTNPEQYEKEIRDFSRLMYVSKGVYYTAINYYTNLPSLDYNMIPVFYEMDNLEAILESKNTALRYCEDILNKPSIRNIIKAVLKDSGYYGYEREGNGTYYLQRLPSEFCREGAIIEGSPSIEFNFKFFDRNEDRLKLYDREFTTKFNKYKNNSKGNKGEDLQWQTLDHTKTICIPLESEDFNFPALTGIFDDLIDLDDYYAYMKSSTELETSKILIQTPPMNKETGELLADPDEFLFFQNAIAEVLDKKYKIVSTPFDVDSIDFAKGKSGDAGFGGVEQMKTSIWNGSGVSKSVFGDTDGATAQRVNYEVNANYIYAIVDKIELWANKRLRRLNTQYPFKISYLKTTNLYRKETFDMFRALSDIGGSIEVLISSAGINPEDYKRQLMLENLEKVKDMLRIPESVHTQSGKQEGKAGRQKVDNISDSGDKTRDSDSNDDR